MRCTHRHVLKMALLAIPLCLIVSAAGMTQDKTAGDESGDSQTTTQEKAGDEDGFQNSGGGFGRSSFESGGYGTAGFSYAGPKNERLIVGKNIMISWSKENDELRGFSQKTGEWTNLKIEKQEKLVPVLSTDVAAVRVGDTMAAYSGSTGTWDVLKLSQDSKSEPTVYATHVQTTDNNYLYTFAAAKGKWTSPNDPKFRPSKADYRDAYGSSTTPPTPSGLGTLPPSANPLGALIGGRPQLVPLSEDPTRAQLLQLNLEALHIAQKYRGKGLDDQEARKALTKVVELAFDKRQKQQATEANRLQEKLKQIQEAIEKRKSLRDKIIQRRVDELLDPNVEWDKAFPGGGSSLYGPSGRSLSYPSPMPNQKETSVIQRLTTEQVAVDIDLVEAAPKDTFEKGECLVITGLLQDAATHSVSDFELQRQEFSSMPDPESLAQTPWKRFNIQRSIKVIQNSAGVHADQLPVELTNPVMTEPLPMLKSGNWSAAAIHPDLRQSLNDPPDNTSQFRVIDFDVQPNHWYRYRVRLATAVQGQQNWGDWSQPTNPIKIR